MCAIRTSATVAGAVALGLVSGWLTSRVGGSLERAPTAVVVMIVTLGGTGLCVGLLLGLFNEPISTAVALVAALLSYYAASWLFSPFHSVPGDILFMAVSCVPACLAAIAGFLLGRALMRASRT
jgi:hypothetical protein